MFFLFHILQLWVSDWWSFFIRSVLTIHPITYYYESHEEQQPKVLNSNLRFFKSSFSFDRFWSCFDGVCQGRHGRCRVGMILHLSHRNYFKLKLDAGLATNTRDELIALWVLLLFANQQGLQILKIAGDSKAVAYSNFRTMAGENSTIAKVFSRNFSL